MVGKFDAASQKVTPRDAQKGGQGALSKEHPEIELRQDPPAARDVPVQNDRLREDLTADEIDLLCDIEERDASKLTQDRMRDIEPLLSKGYIEPLASDDTLADAVGTPYRLTAKGIDFLSRRGVGLNEA